MAEYNDQPVALITGAAGGLGHAFAVRLAREGMRIAVVDCVDADHVVRAIEQQGGVAQAFRSDLREPEQIAYLQGQVLERFGRCDVLVNNAAYIPLKNLADTSLLDWSDCLAVTLDASFLLSQAFAPGMRERGWGRIINLASSRAPAKGLSGLHRRQERRDRINPRAGCGAGRIRYHRQRHFTGSHPSPWQRRCLARAVVRGSA